MDFIINRALAWALNNLLIWLSITFENTSDSIASDSFPLNNSFIFGTFHFHSIFKLTEMMLQGMKQIKDQLFEALLSLRSRLSPKHLDRENRLEYQVLVSIGR